MPNASAWGTYAFQPILANTSNITTTLNNMDIDPVCTPPVFINAINPNNTTPIPPYTSMSSSSYHATDDDNSTPLHQLVLPRLSPARSGPGAIGSRLWWSG